MLYANLLSGNFLQEWELQYIFEEPDGQCICGHKPITERCIISNKSTGKELGNCSDFHMSKSETVLNFAFVHVEVGNVCVQRFGGEISKLSRSSFAALKRIRLNPVSRRANVALINLAFRRGVINIAGRNMYQDSWRKRYLTKAQNKYLVGMNEQILFAFGHSPRVCTKCARHVYAKKSQRGNAYYACCGSLQ